MTEMRTVRKYVEALVREFRPEKAILFGSRAHQRAGEDSDVDLLVILPCRGSLSKAVEIRRRIPRSFALDLIVKSPREMRSRRKQQAGFFREVVKTGKVLYERQRQ